MGAVSNGTCRIELTQADVEEGQIRKAFSRKKVSQLFNFHLLHFFFLNYKTV